MAQNPKTDPAKTRVIWQKVLENLRPGGRMMPRKGHTEEQIVAALQ